MNILAIDPGNTFSAYVLMDGGSYEPRAFGKVPNEELLDVLASTAGPDVPVILEMVASYGMAVGREVFDTCVWIGRFTQAAVQLDAAVAYVYRMEEKQNLCHDSRAKDSHIRQALIDRFAAHDFKSGKGTKRDPDFFYGFKADVWAAFAVGTTYLDRNTP